MSAIIRFKSVSKKYRLRHERPNSLRDAFFRILGNRLPSAVVPSGLLWALKDVSFEIERGETVGLVGANGAGKSTTLKLISGVSTPNSGQIEVTGRIGALLELGAGFHPELSGRDNVYLNGALLGLGRKEMHRKFDAIVAFSELEEFIDVPVKHYSSGMFARLAFAVSIHVEPDVLLIDEVLSVGDVAFQEKCLGRIADLKRQGVTIVLVSHSEDLVRTQCMRALWFNHGCIQADGSVETVLSAYSNWRVFKGQNSFPAMPDLGIDQVLNRPARLTGVEFHDETGQATTVFETGSAFHLTIRYKANARIVAPVFGVGIYTQEGSWLTGPNTDMAGLDLPLIEGDGEVIYFVPVLPLLPGIYFISLALHNRSRTVMYDYLDHAFQIRVVNQRARIRERHGVVTLFGEWTHRAVGSTVG